MDTRTATETTPLQQDNSHADTVIDIYPDHSSAGKLETHLDDDARREIIDNLIAINITNESAHRILDAIESMPGKDHIKGALRFLTQIREERCQREEYYQWSKYVAEFFCTVSNLGFFAVGAYSVRFSILIAATFSALSHAFPFQRLQQLDYLGVLSIFIEAVTEYKAIAERPIALAWGAGALGIAMFDNMPSLSDRFFPGCKKKCDEENPIFKSVVAPWVHSIWHLAAAAALLMFYETIVDITHRNPSKTEQTIAMVWGCIGMTLCLIALAEGLMRKTYSSCKSTFFNNTNDSTASSEATIAIEDNKKLTSLLVKK